MCVFILFSYYLVNHHLLLWVNNCRLFSFRYTTIARENPGRILRIYVRDVTTVHVKDLPPAKPKYSYARTFPRMYNYLRNHYSAEDEANKPETPDEKEEEAAVTQGLEETQEAENLARNLQLIDALCNANYFLNL